MRLLTAPHRGLNHLAFSPDGRWLAGGGNGPGVTVWDIPAGRPRPHPRDPLRFRPVLALAFDPTDGTLAAIGGSWLARIDPVADPADAADVFAPNCCLLAPDGRLALSRGYAADDSFLHTLHAVGAAGRWEPAGELPPLPNRWHFPLGLRTDGRLVVSSGDGLYLHPGGNAPDPPPAADFTNRRAVVAADGRVASFGRHVAVWRPGSGWTPAVSDALADAAFHPDGATLLTAGRDGVARLRDADTLAERAAFDFGLGRLRACAVAPVGLTAAVASATRVVVFDL